MSDNPLRRSASILFIFLNYKIRSNLRFLAAHGGDDAMYRDQDEVSHERVNRRCSIAWDIPLQMVIDVVGGPKIIK